MCKVNILEAKTNLAKLIVKFENHEEEEIIICRNGNLVVRVTLMPHDVSRRLGSFKGQFVVPEDIDEMNDEIAEMF